jgi:long-chain fatty acid transport protein
MNIYGYSINLGRLAGVMLSAMGGSALASGFDLPDQDAFAVGRGLAVTATADNPSAIFYNPAGLTQLTGNNFEVGGYGIYLDPSYTRPSSGKSYHNQEPWGAIPQFFYAYGNKENTFSIGLGIYAPAGLNMQWPQDTGFRTVGYKGSIEQIAFNPVIAFKIIPSLSVGVGISANYVNLNLEQGILWPEQPYDQFKFEGNGWAPAGNIGILWQPTAQWSVGAALQTGTSVKLNGSTAAFNNVALPGYPTFHSGTDASTDLQLPLKVEGGISFRPTENWNIEFDADYINWNTLNTLNIQQNNPYPIFPKNVPLILNWESSWYYELGVTRYLDNGWHVSAGYIFNQNSVPSSHYTPVVADEDRHFFSIGVGRKGQHFDFDIAYQFGYGSDRTVSGSASSTSGQSADGTYNFFSNAVSASVGWHF